MTNSSITISLIVQRFDYLSWIFGLVDWVFGHLNKQSDLDVDVEDIAQCLLGFKNRENDKFDEGPGNVMNYGHSFGHAIELPTNS